MLGLVVVDLVDGDGGVDNTWLNSLFLDDWLDGLVNVVVNVLADDLTAGTLGCLDITNLAGASELLSLGLKTLLDVRVIAVLDLAVVDCGLVMCVLLWKDLLIVDWLD